MNFNPANEDQPQNWEEMLRAMFDSQNLEALKRQVENGELNIPSELADMLKDQNLVAIGHQLQQQMRFLLANSDTAVNWKLAQQVARETINYKYSESLSPEATTGARTALSTASLWLDAATELGAVTQGAQAWSRLDWITHSASSLQKLLDPVGENISRALTQALTTQLSEVPNDMLRFMGDPSQLITKLTSAILGTRFGQALADLAHTSFGSTDTGLPLLEAQTAALIPTNITEFAKDLDIAEAEILSYIAVREVAAARLFANVTWLRPRILDTVAEFARGIQIDTQAIAQQMQEVTFNSPEGVTEIDLSNVFVMEMSETQLEILARLEHLISLVEGWISEVSARAVAAHLPNAVPLREMFNRRYATNNPAKHVWVTQLGMNLAPKQLRNAVKFWQLAEYKLGIAQRDALWNHPDLLPTPAGLENPEDFFRSTPESEIAAELDSFLANLFATDSSSPDFSTDSTPPDVSDPDTVD